MTQLYSLAIKNSINEIKNIVPEVSTNFVFRKGGEIIAQDDTTSQELINEAVNAFNETQESAETIGSIENLTIQGDDGQVNITCINNLYLTTVSSRQADQKMLNAMSRVLIPTLIKLVNQIESAAIENMTVPNADSEPTINDQEDAATSDSQTEETEPTEQASEEPAEIQDSGPILPEPPVNQFIVEKLSGLMVSSDTVRVDNETINKWIELYENKKIEQVNIETLSGKRTQCKFKPIKESKYNGKGIIQIPEKIQLTLEIAKGELVMVKPIIN
jgi:hypothetical protein